MVANILPADLHPPPPDHGVWVQYVKIRFLEQGHDAYQIKGKYKCSNMVAKNLPADTPTPSDPGVGSIGQNITFSQIDYVAYQIK